MLDEKGFDLWADGYDKDVALSDEENSYPFAGYKAVLGGVFRRVMEGPHASVLDIGFGTAVLTAKLYEQGCAVSGQDLSGRMVAIAQEKMPAARLFRGDIAEGLAEPLRGGRYDCILATYSLHHLTDAQKIGLIEELLPLLKEGGRLLIGDVAFEDRAALNECRAQAGDEWDEDEYYFVFEELKDKLPALTFEKISFCAGILTIEKTDLKEVKNSMIIRKPELHTPRLTLRAYTEKDRERLADLLTDEEVTKTFMVPDYPDREQYLALADKLIAFSQPEDETHLEYGVFLGEEMIGFVNDCGFDDEELEVGYIIDPKYQGHGYATEAVKAVIGAMWALGFKKVTAGYFEGNEASRRVMEKCGMHATDAWDEGEYRGEKHRCLYCEILRPAPEE